MNGNQESLRRALSKNWGLITEPALDIDDLRNALASKLREFLKEDFHGLVQAMYRLDINESKFHRAMSEPDIELQIRALTELIIEREIQRIHFREKYRNNDL